MAPPLHRSITPPLHRSTPRPRKKDAKPPATLWAYSKFMLYASFRRFFRQRRTLQRADGVDPDSDQDPDPDPDPAIKAKEIAASQSGSSKGSRWSRCPLPVVMPSGRMKYFCLKIRLDILYTPSTVGRWVGGSLFYFTFYLYPYIYYPLYSWSSKPKDKFNISLGVPGIVLYIFWFIQTRKREVHPGFYSFTIWQPALSFVSAGFLSAWLFFGFLGITTNVRFCEPVATRRRHFILFVCLSICLFVWLFVCLSLVARATTVVVCLAL